MTTTTTTAMHMLVPYSHNHPRRDLAAIDEACRLAHSGDAITVLACVIVPSCYAVDVIPGAAWKQTCLADRALARALARAEAYLESHVAEGVTVHIFRVQARDESAGIVAGAMHRHADLILMGGWPAPLTGVAARFGVAGTVARRVECGVQVVSATKRHVSLPVSEAVAPVSARYERGHGLREHTKGERANDVHRS